MTTKNGEPPRRRREGSEVLGSGSEQKGYRASASAKGISPDRRDNLNMPDEPRQFGTPAETIAEEEYRQRRQHRREHPPTPRPISQGDALARAMPVSNDTTQMMEQAKATADEYLRAARHSIDDEFGDGYAAKHPELMGAFMQTTAMDLLTWAVRRSGEQIADSIESAARELAEAAS